MFTNPTCFHIFSPQEKSVELTTSEEEKTGTKKEESSSEEGKVSKKMNMSVKRPQAMADSTNKVQRI